MRYSTDRGSQPVMYRKELYTRKTGGELPQLVITQSENNQSRYVVQRILELREQGIPLEEIAVLFRSSFLSADLEIELAIANIPFVKYGGFKFVETAHIKDLIAHLRVLENPKDIVSWNRILQLVDGIGPRTAEKIIDDILASRVGAETRGRETMVTSNYWLQYQAFPNKVHSLFSVLEPLAKSKSSPSERAFHIIEYYREILRSRYDDYSKRIKDLDVFQNITERYDTTEKLLTDLALEPPTRSVVDIEAPDLDTERLVLSTIHSAKGLEWNSVFVIYALEGRFPSYRALQSEEELEEERRLMYVACTRAKEHLFITYPINIFDNETGTVLSKPSRFIEGIGEKLLEPCVVEG
jgi:DNA helicase-2/ATP-dependent DNA helicase PcrA